MTDLAVIPPADQNTGKDNEMAHKVIFSPRYGSDANQIVLENGKRIHFDFRHLLKTEAGKARKSIWRSPQGWSQKGKQDIVALAFTHGDKDHIENSTEFFELHHANKYQGEGPDQDRRTLGARFHDLDTASTMTKAPSLWSGAKKHATAWNRERVFVIPPNLKNWLGLNRTDWPSIQDEAWSLMQANSPQNSTWKSDGVEFATPHSLSNDEGDDLH